MVGMERTKRIFVLFLGLILKKTRIIQKSERFEIQNKNGD